MSSMLKSWRYGLRSLQRKWWYFREKMTEVPIYTISVFTLGDGTNRTFERDRTWGFYYDFDTAEEAVLNNWTDMFECGYYDYAVINRVYPSCLATNDESFFYKATYVGGRYNETTVEKCEEPALLQERRTYIGAFC